jgi:hypothetical protein
MAMMLNQAKSGLVQKMLDVTPTPAQTKANNELQDKLAAILTGAEWNRGLLQIARGASDDLEFAFDHEENQ